MVQDAMAVQNPKRGFWKRQMKDRSLRKMEKRIVPVPEGRPHGGETQIDPYRVATEISLPHLCHQSQAAANLEERPIAAPGYLSPELAQEPLFVVGIIHFPNDAVIIIFQPFLGKGLHHESLSRLRLEVREIGFAVYLRKILRIALGKFVVNIGPETKQYWQAIENRVHQSGFAGNQQSGIDPSCELLVIQPQTASQLSMLVRYFRSRLLEWA